MLGDGFKVPTPEKFSHVKVLQYFTGQNTKGRDFRFYNEYYTDVAMHCLLHSPITSHKRPLRIFLSSRDELSIQESFHSQLGNFNFLRNSLDKPGVFIINEPGARSDQYIVGILLKDKLLIINPNGKSTDPGFYQVLHRLQSETKLKIYIDEQSFHHKQDPSRASVGPICIELVWHFYKQKLKTLFKAIEKEATPQKEGKLNYQRVCLKEHLPAALQDLQNEKDFSVYKTLIWNIRLNHYFHLLTICKFLDSESEANQFFEECINAPEQQLVERLMSNELCALEFDNDPLYVGLKEGNASKLAIKIQHRSKKEEQKEKVLVSSIQEKDDVATLKRIRNIMLLTLILIPVAHFLLWPYLGSVLSVAAFEFLTASTTPWLMAVLSVALFTSAIVAVAAYDSHSQKPVLQQPSEKNKEPEIDLESYPEALRFADPSYQSVLASSEAVDPAPSNKSSRGRLVS